MRDSGTTPRVRIVACRLPNVCFCNGPLCQAAPVYPAAGNLLLSVVSMSCHIIRSEEAVSRSFERSLERATADIAASPTSPSQRRDLGSADLSSAHVRSSPSYAIAVSSFDQRKLVPSTHIRWRMTPSLRAKATLAFFVPRRLATAIPHAFRPEKRTVRVSMALAAS